MKGCNERELRERKRGARGCDDRDLEREGESMGGGGEGKEGREAGRQAGRMAVTERGK